MTKLTLGSYPHLLGFEQLERLLAVDRSVAVRQVVFRDRAGEPRRQAIGIHPIDERPADRGLGPGDVLGLDLGPEAGTVGGVGRVGKRSHRTVSGLLGDADDALHERKRSMVAVVGVDHGQAVGGRRDRVAPPELGPRCAMGYCLPDQLARVGVGAQQADDVAADLADVVFLDAPAQADRGRGPYLGRFRSPLYHQIYLILRQRIAAFRCEMAASDPGCRGAAGATRGAMLDVDEPEGVGFDTAGAHALWKDLFGGIEASIADKTHLVLVPPADLLDLPFAALVTSPEPPSALGGIDWLIRRHAISVLPSVAGLRTLRGRAREQSLAPFLGVGDPEIGSGGGIACEAMTTIAMRAAAPTQPLIAPSPSGLGLADVAAIAALPRPPDAACEAAVMAVGDSHVPVPSTPATVAAPAPEDVIDWIQVRTSVVCTSATATPAHRGST